MTALAVMDDARGYHVCLTVWGCVFVLAVAWCVSWALWLNYRGRRR